ncbi:Zn(II)2Cys6 transcription factor [Aspergillus clavatus NRRL 1]|uniref:C6 zinc finger domain protein n=1 Tax=Aspergillus clavatus (strain ATCC 1007 / CBS 513.65 / DSM 816 / NCTC 3887 / NRRL 1 / QM 1276 / 107) TaxID=344612 RepID=A1CSM7_ASPCL|nr:C6 zinc finger domain protein [Aspergillus clavatus NRRL 1]EAW06314.1 C6 zinc finger domain protein [Aspergillus clavatus NRRL 1]
MTTPIRVGAKRLPISCQACRSRKIRCSRDGRPCQTCVRRGLGAEDCIYLGQPRLSFEHPAADLTVQNELLARIRNLEDVLQRQMGLHSETPGSDSLSSRASPAATSSFLEPDTGPGSGFFHSSSSAVMGNVGTLQTFASGYVRYLPVAPHWSSVLVTGSNTETLQNIDSEVPEDDDDLQIPLVKSGSTSRDELLAALPPGRYCDALKQVYFKVFSPMFHILHDLTFEAEYQQFRHDPSSVTVAWIALLFTILGIAVTALDDNDPLLSDLGREKTVSRNIKVLSARYRSAALRCLAADNIMSRHSINSLQSLVLLSYARLHRGLPTWTFLGFTHHVAIAMGCHVDPERFALGPIEREERRRAWASLTMLYTIQNSFFGYLDRRILAQDVRLPLDVNDVNLLTGTVSEPVTGPTQMTYLLLQIRLYKVAFLICETLFTFPARLTVPQLEAELLAVHEVCDKRYHLDLSAEPLPAHHQANLNILYNHIHQQFLLLLRPALCRHLRGEINPETCAAKAKCVTSAKASLAIHKSMFESPSFTAYKWYNSGLGSFHAFHAAVTLCIIIMMAPESQFEFSEVKDLLRESLDVFAALSNRSNFCSKAVPVLRRILDAVSSRNINHHHHHHHHQIPTPGADASVSPRASVSVSPTPLPGYAHPRSPTEFAMEPLLAQLHPQNWLYPLSVPWNGWDVLTQVTYGPQQHGLG